MRRMMIGEEIEVNGWGVVRVPGGWIWSGINKAVFVPDYD